MEKHLSMVGLNLTTTSHGCEIYIAVGSTGGLAVETPIYNTNTNLQHLVL